jgi:hypothetical protein
MDIKQCFRVFFEKNPSNLVNGMEQVGMAFEGRAHSGVVDARNTARLLAVMKSKGFVVRLTRDRAEATRLAAAAAAATGGGGRVGSALVRASGGSSAGAARDAVHKDPTPPFCLCMRRAKRTTISCPGPNIGRSYYKCNQPTVKNPCSFFVWGGKAKRKTGPQ